MQRGSKTEEEEAGKGKSRGQQTVDSKASLHRVGPAVGCSIWVQPRVPWQPRPRGLQREERAEGACKYSTDAAVQGAPRRGAQGRAQASGEARAGTESYTLPFRRCSECLVSELYLTPAELERSPASSHSQAETCGRHKRLHRPKIGSLQDKVRRGVTMSSSYNRPEQISHLNSSERPRGEEPKSFARDSVFKTRQRQKYFLSVFWGNTPERTHGTSQTTKSQTRRGYRSGRWFTAEAIGVLGKKEPIPNLSPPGKQLTYKCQGNNVLLLGSNFSFRGFRLQ